MTHLLRRLFLFVAALLVPALAATAFAQENMSGASVAHDPVRNRYLVAHLGDNNALDCGLVDASGVRTTTPVALSTGMCNTPAVVRDGDLDRFLVVWNEYNMASGMYDVRARFVSPDGALLGGTFDVATGLQQRTGPRVVYSPWSQRYLVVFTSFTSIEARYVQADGTLPDPRFTVIAGTSGAGYQYAFAPALEFDSVNHRFLVTALLTGSSYPPMSLYGAVVDDTQAVSMVREPYSIFDSTTFIYPPALAFDPVHQRYLVMYEVYTGTGHQLEARLLDTIGGAAAPAWLIVDDASVSFGNSVCFRPGDGTFLAAWLGGGSGGAGVYARVIAANGANAGARYFIGGPELQFDLALAHNAVDGNTLVAYGNYATSILVVTPAPPATDLAVTLDADPQALIGRPITLTAAVANDGAEAAPKVKLTLTLPAGATFVSATSPQGACSEDAGTVTCDAGTVQPGGAATMTVVVTAAAAGPLHFAAGFASGAQDTNAANDTAAADVSVRAHLAVSPARGTTGAEIEIACDALGTAKGRVRLVQGRKRVALQILEWNSAGSGIVRARLRKAPPAGAWDVTVLPRTPKGAPPVTEAAAFDVAAPQILACPSQCDPGTTIDITCAYPGTARGTVLIETTSGTKTRRRKAKILVWPTDPAAATGVAGLKVVIPKAIPEGPMTLVVKTSAGEARAASEIGD